MSKKNKIEPSVASTCRNINPGNGVFLQTNWRDRHTLNPDPVIIQRCIRLGAQGNKGQKEENTSKPNPQGMDKATLRPDRDTLIIDFTVVVTPGIMDLHACDSPAFLQKYNDRCKSLDMEDVVSELSSRYANKIADASWAWRNKMVCTDWEVVVRVDNDENMIFSEKNTDDISKLSGLIYKGLTNTVVYLKVRAYLRLGESQDVYPSQEFPTSDTKTPNGSTVSKILYSVDGRGLAGMHSEKLGNALRTIDDWYPGAAGNKIAVEFYGTDSKRGIAHRKDADNSSFYKIFDAWMNDDDLSQDDIKYMVAIFIRGGLLA